MATSTVRFAIIVVLVVVGAVLIAQFPDASTASRASGGTTTPTESATPPPGGTGGTNGGTGNGGQQTPTAQVRGVKLAVYNGTTETGLAAGAAADLVDQFGYRINAETSIADAPDPVDQTTLYYVSPPDKVEAEALADSYFKKLDVKIAKLPSDVSVPDGVRVAVYLGTDYAQTR